MANDSKFNHILKSNIIDELSSKNPNIPTKEVHYAINTILELMSSTIAAGNRIELRGFGTFTLKKYQPKQSRNPKTGEKIASFQRFRPHFKPSKSLKEKVYKSYKKDA